MPSRIPPFKSTILSALASCILALLVTAPGASADLSFCPFGSAAGQCKNASGMAGDWETGHLYLADQENNRVSVFAADGTFLVAFGWGVIDGSPKLQSCTTASGCRAGLSGSGAGQFSGRLAISVDNSSTSPSHHDVYVGEEANRRVQKFDDEGNFLLAFGKGVNSGTSGQPNLCTSAGPPASVCGAGGEGDGLGEFNSVRGLDVTTSGAIYVTDAKVVGDCNSEIPFGDLKYDRRLQVFNELGAPLEEMELTGVPCGRTEALAVDSTGDFYLANGLGTSSIHKYDPDGKELCTIDYTPPVQDAQGAYWIQTSALAVDSSDNLYASQREPEAGNLLRMITKYDSSCDRLRRFGYGMMEGAGRGLAPFHSAAGDVFAAEGAAASNAIHYFTLPAPGPLIVPGRVALSAVGSVKATFNLVANPEGKATTYHFEYVDQEGFEESGFSGPKVIHTPDVPLGSDFTLHGASQDVTVVPETRYHFRAVATNEDGVQTLEGEPFETPESIQIGDVWSTDVGTDSATLHAEVNPQEVPASGYFEVVDEATYQESGFAGARQVPDVAGGAGALDFGAGGTALARSASLYPLKAATTYHYRLIAKNALVEVKGPERVFTTGVPGQPSTDCANQAFRTSFSAALPDCRAYEMVSPLDKNNGDIVVLGEFTTGLPATIYQSSTSGERLTFGAVRAFGDVQSAPWTSQYLSARGPQGWNSEAISPPRTTPDLQTVDLNDTEFKMFSPDLCDAWLRSQTDLPLAAGALEGYPNLYRDSLCGERGYEALSTAEPPHVAPYPTSAQYRSLELQGLSGDGSVSIYVANDNLTPDAPNNSVGRLQLYRRGEDGQTRFVCFLPNGKASLVDCTAGGFGGILPFFGGGKSRYSNVQGAISADGSRVYWTAGKGPGQIYLRLNAGQAQSKVSAGDCTEAEKACTLAVSETVSPEPARFWSAALDGSKAIFTISEKGDVSDLYEFDAEADGTSTLIAKGVKGVLGTSENASRVYFTSTEVLGEGAVEGDPNLYLYEAGEAGGIVFIGALASADESSSFAAVSKNPSLRRSRVSPDGRHVAFMSSASLTGYDSVDARVGKTDAEVYLFDADTQKLVCASCNPSGARPVGVNLGRENLPFWAAGSLSVWQNELYATRALSDDGSRLYFESSDALIPADTNGVMDVYQWQEADSGDCTVQSPVFSTQNGGCVDLISSGQSPRDSSFVDASPDGSDVFIATLSSLLPQDYGLVDIYDAREGGGYPPQPNPPAACEGEACQGPLVPPSDPTPASSAYEGPGNPPAAKKKAKKKKKTSKKAKGHEKHKRANHKRRAGR